MPIRYRVLFLLSGALTCFANANAQAPIIYEEESAFLADVATPTLIDFEGIADPGSFIFLGNPGSYSENGVTIENFTNMFVINDDARFGTGSFLSAQGGEGQLVVINLPANTVAVGFSYAIASTAAGSVSLSSNTGFPLTVPDIGSLGFFGAVLESGFADDRVVIGVSGVGIVDLDNVWFLVDPNPTPSGTYTNEATFLAELESPALIDFEGVAAPGEDVYIGNPGVYLDSGVTFSNNSQMFVRNQDGLYGSGSFLAPQGADPQIIDIYLPENTLAVGFSYSYSNYGSSSAVVSVDGGPSYLLATEPAGGLGFFGVIRSATPIESLTITVYGSVIDIDNVWFLIDPDAPPTEVYRQEADFLAELDSPVLTDFEGIAEPGEGVGLDVPGEFTSNDLAIRNNWFMYVINSLEMYGGGSYLSAQGENPAVVTFEMPANVVAFGFSYAYANYGGASATVEVDGAGGYVLPPEPSGSMGFFGVIRDKPIGVVTVTVDGPVIDFKDVWMLVDPGAPAPDFYRNEVAFLAEAGSPTLIDFEGIADPGESVDFGNPGAFVGDGVRIANESNMFVQDTDYYGTASYLSPQGADPQTVLIQLPQNTFAVGLSYNSLAGTATINGSEVFSLNAQYFNQLGFFGVVRDEPIESISITADDAGIDLDNIWFVAGPSAGRPNIPGGGEVDTAFGTNGVVLLNDLFQSDIAEFYGLGVQPAGGIIIAGATYNVGQEVVVQVARLKLSGELDTTFGDNGVRSVYVGLGGGRVYDVSILPDGGILAAGLGAGGTVDGTSVLFKLNVDGDIDTSFGTSGIVTENLDTDPENRPVDSFIRMVNRKDGQILLGTAWLGVHQYNPDGSRDYGFGISGIAQPENSEWSNLGLAEAADGGIVFGSIPFSTTSKAFVLGKYLSDGSNIDAAFGNNGVVSQPIGAGVDELVDLIIDAKDRIVAVGYTDQPGFNPTKTAVARFLPDGQLDPEFGYGGIRVLDGLPLRRLYISRVINRPDGGLLLSGEVDAPSPLPDQEIFVMSLNEDGTLDESFAGKGWQELDVAPDPEERSLTFNRDAMAVHPAGKIVVLNWWCDCMTLLEAPPWGGGRPGDQDGDGKADILWRNVANGQNAVWLMDGGQRLANIGMQPADPTWRVVGRGDYNGDGTSDILWRRVNPGQANNGQMLIWLLQGGEVIGTSALPSVGNDNWQVVGDGDHNGDGHSDILWRNVASGRNAMWLINDGNRTATPAVIRASVLDWEIVGDGDFDGDGKADILWRNRLTGENAVWLMDGATRTANASLPAVPGTEWQVVGSADYGGDGKADILWRNVVNGSNALWTMDGTTRVGNKGIPAVTNLKWSIIGDDDYNGDGRADILWRQTVNGRNAVWLMDGDQRLASQKVPTVRVGDWEPVNVN